MPAISVIIPVHDLGRYLAETVQSVLDQTCQDFEILILDDGSTDPETCALLDDFQRPRTKVFRGPNRGLGPARNFLLGEAQGRVICALDADDLLHPTYLERTLAALEADPELAFVSTWLRTFGIEEEVYRPTSCDLETLLAECQIHCSSLVRREVLDAVGGYDGAMPHMGDEDWDLWIRILRAGYRGQILPEVLFDYRRRGIDSMGVLCTQGQVRRELWRYKLSKHEEVYREHALSVLERRDRELGTLLQENDALEARLAGELGPRLRARLAELERLRARSSEPDPRAEELAAARAELAAARARVAALESSLSWRLAAPLRRGYDLLAALRGQRGQP